MKNQVTLQYKSIDEMKNIEQTAKPLTVVAGVVQPFFAKIMDVPFHSSQVYYDTCSVLDKLLKTAVVTRLNDIKDETLAHELLTKLVKSVCHAVDGIYTYHDNMETIDEVCSSLEFAIDDMANTLDKNEIMFAFCERMAQVDADVDDVNVVMHILDDGIGIGEEVIDVIRVLHAIIDEISVG